MSSQSISNRHPQSKTQRFTAASGNLPAAGADLPAPVRWVAQLVQRLVAIILITIGKAIEMTFKKDGGSSGAAGRRRRRTRG